MNSKLKTVLTFFSGVASGVAGAIIFVKIKWQKSFDDKRNEMIEYFEKKEPKKEEVSEEKEEEAEEAEEEIKADGLKTAETIIRNYNYSKLSSSSEPTKNTSPILNDCEFNDKPYIIESVEYGTKEMYDMVTLFLYDDGVVHTEKYEILSEEDLENYIGTEVFKQIADLRDAEPEKDACYVRNELLKTDYEIVFESGRYEE